MIVYLAADHAGFELKESIKKFLSDSDYEVRDFGAFTLEPDDDYPDFIKIAAEAVSKCEQGSPSTDSMNSPQASSGQKCRALIF